MLRISWNRKLLRVLRGAPLFMLLFGSSLVASAQSMLLSGTVRDRNSYRPIQDVNITVEGSTLGTSTDVSGAFRLRLDGIAGERSITFRHISYEMRTLTVDEVKRRDEILLQPRVIPLQSAEITETRREGVAARDIPQRVVTIESREFEVRGYVDAGDLLRTDHSIQVDEELSGRKSVSIRGGNADEVIVLYNGIRLNSSFSNEFDLSLIELSDIERFEIIKGSNTSLYGSEAFAGVINIVPKRERDYTVRAHQQIGSYDSGIWGVQLFRRFGKLTGSYSLRSGGMTRAFEDFPDDALTNSSVHHGAHFNWTFGDAEDHGPDGMLTAHWRHASQEYVNERDSELLDDRNHIGGLQYNGRIGSIEDISLATSYSRLDQDVQLRSGDITILRGIDEHGIQAHVEKGLGLGDADLRFAYQFAGSSLDFSDTRQNVRQQSIGLESALLSRTRHGLVAIGKLHGETGSTFLRTFDFDVSLRQDFVRDAQDETVLRTPSSGTGLFQEHDWSHSLFKFAVNLKGVQDDLLLDVFLSYGGNVKYPSLMQQISAPVLVSAEMATPSLEPETNRSVEIGLTLLREITGQTVTGWEITGSFFQNSYTNKFRSYSSASIPVLLYDNVDNAQISGFEGGAGLYMFSKKVLAEIGLSRYFISERAAFPFKSESKRTLSLRVDHAGYSLHALYFFESEQIGMLRQSNGDFTEVELPEFSNLDLHASRYIPVGGARLFLNVSFRNLLGGQDVMLSGLAIRDRRYYITAGIQY